MTMVEELLAAVPNQLEQSDPPVKAAALLHLARVLAKSDPDAAQRTLERGIDLATDIPEPEGPCLLSQAVYLAAAVSPPHAVRLMPVVSGRYHRNTEGAIFNMLSHGHLAAAVSYLTDPPAHEPYPFHAAQQAFGYSRDDDETRQKIVRGAVQAWRAESPTSPSHAFEDLFVHCWKILPVAEAIGVVREIVRRILGEPDGDTSASYSSGPKVAELTSIRESRLFQIIDPLRQLDPELAESLCRKYHQLAAAAAVFPHGYYGELEAPPAETSEPSPPKAANNRTT